MSTTLLKKETLERKWYVLDAAGKPLGRTAVEAANILRGKHKVDFTPMLTAATMSSSSTPTRLFRPARSWIRRPTTAFPAGSAV